MRSTDRLFWNRQRHPAWMERVLRFLPGVAGQERLGFAQVAEPRHHRPVRVHQRPHLPGIEDVPP